MIDSSTVLSIISVCIAASSFVFNRRKDNKAEDTKEATEITTVIVKLENISNDTKDIKNELRNIRTEVGELRERVIVAEQAAKSLHKRVDCFENRLEHLNEKIREEKEK